MLFQPCGDPDAGVLIQTAEHRLIGQVEFSPGQSPGFIKHHGIDGVHGFQGVTASRQETKPSQAHRGDVIAVGVARDRAQGQVTTSTESVISKALSAPASHQPAQTTGASISTRPTNLPAMRSAIRATGGFSDCTRSRTRKMPDSRVWAPAWVTRMSSGFSSFTLPA